MTKKERAKLRRQRKVRRFVLTIALMALVAAIAIGGTLAWLTDATAPIKNTFTVGNINIDLDESKNLDLKMVPGKTITKDPKAIVEANSEACWLFVKVEKEGGDVTVGSTDYNFDNFLNYSIATGWTPLTDVDGVYYQEVAANTTNQTFSVLDGDKVTVLSTVTKDMMDAIETDSTKAPTLTFTAYACQQAGRTVDEAAVELGLKDAH